MKTILRIVLFLSMGSPLNVSAEESRPDPERTSNATIIPFETDHAVTSSDNRVSTLSSDTEYTLNSMQIPRQIPPSPTAASLGVYGAIPVGYYTGIPQIEIPLYEIKCGSLTIPISLSYHASGIRVAAEAGWAGMGWTLNAGGAITRSVAGVDDFNDTNYKSLAGFSISYPIPRHGSNEIILTDEGEVLLGDIPCYDDFYKGFYDSKPDVFNYNIGHYSGQMAFPKRAYDAGTGNFASPMLLNRDPLKISYHRTGAYERDGGEWTVKTPDGACYYYKTAELTRDTSIILNPPPKFYENRQPQVYTAWYPDKIVGAYQETVEFIYEKHAMIQSQKQGYYDQGMHREVFHPTICTRFSTHSYSISTNDEILLKEIRFRGGKVLFKTQDRTDLLHRGSVIPQALSQMLVINDQGDTIKRVDFNMGYYNAQSSSTLDRRLRLDGIVENEEKVWSFTYKDGYLPPKNSIMIDYWGYYNGQFQNNNYCPLADIPLSMCIQPLFDKMKLHLGADRNATDAALNGILTRIDYPTGGYTDFEYELHDFNDNNADFDDPYSEYRYKYEYFQDSRHEDDQLIVEFDLTEQAPAYCLVIARYSAGLPCQGTSISNTPYIDFTKTDFRQVDPIWILEKQLDNGKWLLINRRNWDNITCNNVISRTEASWNLSDYGLAGPGKFRITMPTYNNTRANVEMIIPRLKELEDLRGGGARIKRISSVDGNNRQVREYSYKDEDGVSSGIAHTYPANIFIPPIIKYPPGNFYHSSTNVYPSSGPDVAYNDVTETVKRDGEIVYQTRHHFYNSYTSAYYRPLNKNVPSRIYLENGKPRFVITYDAKEKILKETYYDYKRDENSCDTLEGFHIVPFPGLHPTSSLHNFFSLYAEWWYLDSERTTVWENGKPMRSTIKYEYNNDYRKLVSKTMTYADQQVVKEETKHTCDVPTYSHMADLDRIFPVENNLYRNGKFVFGTRNDYDESLVVSNISQKTTEQPNYEQRIQIKWYNNLCNPIYYIKDGTENVVCLWSYIGEYPIAEIKNATMWDVVSALGQEQGDLTYFTTLAQQTAPDMAPIDALREKLPDAQVWTYTYKPLVGMMTATDPAGKTTYYDYDAYGRLSGVRDNDGNTMQSFDYHYKQ